MQHPAPLPRLAAPPGAPQDCGPPRGSRARPGAGQSPWELQHTPRGAVGRLGGGQLLPKPHTLQAQRCTCTACTLCGPCPCTAHTARATHTANAACCRHCTRSPWARTACVVHAAPTALHMLHSLHVSHTQSTCSEGAAGVLGTHCICWVRCTCCTHRHCTPARAACSALHGMRCTLCTCLCCTRCVRCTQRPRMHCANTAHTLHALHAHSYCVRIHAAPPRWARPARVALFAHTLSCAHCTRTACTAHVRCAVHAAGAGVALCTLHTRHTDTARRALRAAPALRTLHAMDTRHKLPRTRTPTLRTHFTSSTPRSVRCMHAPPHPTARTPSPPPCPRRQAAPCAHPCVRTDALLTPTLPTAQTPHVRTA